MYRGFHAVKIDIFTGHINCTGDLVSPETQKVFKHNFSPALNRIFFSI